MRTTRRSYRGWWIAALTIGGLQSLALLQVVQQQNSLVAQLKSRPTSSTQLTSEGGYPSNIGVHGTTHIPLIDKPKKMLVRRHSSGEHAWNPTRAETAAKKTAAKSMGVQKGHTQDSEVIARALPIPSPSRRISSAPN